MKASEERIILAHGSGGRLTHELIARVFASRFQNPILARLDDAAALDVPAGSRLAFTTDSFVVSPLFFPGGDIGKLAVCGTVNDLAMVGAQPRYLSAGWIIEEGLPIADLERIADSMAAAAQEAGVQVVAGDTKVVNRGGADKLFINTAGIGFLPAARRISGDAARPGDVVILSGTMGDHGIAVMSQREGLSFSSALKSDCAPLNGLVEAMLAAGEIHVLRDPTRGGVATTLNELAAQSKVGIEIEEERLPVRQEVRGACEMLGLDPLYVANEGKLLALLPERDVERVLQVMRAQRYGREATIIGRVVEAHLSRVVLRTILGLSRIVDMLVGEQLPRIC
jgi:hydrogenase expression/formation protein HypE